MIENAGIPSVPDVTKHCSEFVRGSEQPDAVATALRTANESNLCIATHEELPSPAVVADVSRRGESYWHHKGGVSFEFDHETQTVTGVFPFKAATDLTPEASAGLRSEHRRVLESELERWVSRADLRGAVAAVYGLQGATGELTLHALISSRVGNEKALWGGEYCSRWSVTLQPNGKKEATLKGSCRVHLATTEDGNVQVRQQRARETTITDYQNAEDLARRVVSAIEDWSSEMRQGIGDFYDRGIIKRLRRGVPKSGQLFDWELLSHQVKDDLHTRLRAVARENIVEGRRGAESDA
eukprot:Polyplicarium_translucidae@DN2932_c0_g1_i1.p1